MLIRAIIDSIESVAPRSAQCEWDNSGMQIGDTGRDIQSVLLTTDVTTDVVNEAISIGCQLIISHHPLLFHGLKQVCGQTEQARVVELCIQHNIAVFSAHTNLDVATAGISVRLAKKLDLADLSFLTESGLGVIGVLLEPMTYKAFLRHVQETLDTTYIRYTSFPVGRDKVRTVALCGGAGAEFIDEAVAQGADVYLTADCKYHEFQDAVGRIGLIDIDHWISERHARDIFKEILAPLDINCYISSADRTPIQIMN